MASKICIEYGMRRFFIEQTELIGQTLSITGSDARHIRHVLRLKPGDRIILFDGKGCEYESEIQGYQQEEIAVLLLRKMPSRAESDIQIVVAQAFLKDKKMDGLVRQLTELGISRWFPFMAERSVSKPDKKRLTARTQRWISIAKEALKQCERGGLPEIGPAVSFEEVLNLGRSCDLSIVFWENETRSINMDMVAHEKPVKKILAVLGPEGGFTTSEIEKAKECGFVTASLGPRILKADTATVVACSLVQYLFGDMGNKALDKDSEFL